MGWSLNEMKNAARFGACQQENATLTIDAVTRHDGRMRNYAISRDGATIWRQGATPDELVRVEAIDVQLHHIEAARAELSRERQALIGRACKRGRRQSDKKLAAE